MKKISVILAVLTFICFIIICAANSMIALDEALEEKARREAQGEKPQAPEAPEDPCEPEDDD
ncbi:MAG: hypothetical protein IKQ92_07435 [Clostridia bacterium]|nr:hypothetical protein [Clostridia bacterium]